MLKGKIFGKGKQLGIKVSYFHNHFLNLKSLTSIVCSLDLNILKLKKQNTPTSMFEILHKTHIFGRNNPHRTEQLFTAKSDSLNS